MKLTRVVLVALLQKHLNGEKVQLDPGHCVTHVGYCLPSNVEKRKWTLKLEGKDQEVQGPYHLKSCRPKKKKEA